MALVRRAARQAPRRLILDSRAVIALFRGDHRARAFLARALEARATLEIPVVVVAETLRKDVALSHGMTSASEYSGSESP